MRLPGAVAAALALGILIGFAVARVLAPSPATGAALAADSTPPPQIPEQPQPGGEIATSASRIPQKAESTPAPPARSPIADALPAGTARKGALQGTVFDGNGGPCAGVEVRALQADLTTVAGSAISGADGRFTIAGLEGHGFVVTARREGWRVAPPVQWAEPGARLFYSAKRPNLRVRLTPPDEFFVPYVQVAVDGGRQGFSLDDPYLEVPAGERAVAAFVGARNGWCGGPVLVEVPPPGEGCAEVEIPLREACGIRVSVARAAGDLSIPSLDVRVAPRLPGTEAQGALDEAARPDLGTPDGRSYFFLPRGAYWVGVRRWGETAYAVREADVADGIVDVALDLPALSLENGLLVTVRLPDGTPACGATVSDNAVERAGGTYALVRSPKVLSVSLRGYGEQRFPLPPSARAATIQLSPPAFLDLTIEESPGAPAGGMSVELSGEVGSFHGDVGTDGRATLGPLQPGDYTLYANVAFGIDPHRRERMAEFPISLGEGRNARSIRLPPLQRVTIRGVSGYASIHPEAGGRLALSLRAVNGVARFERLPPGRYLLELSDRFADLTIPGPAEIEDPPAAAFGLCQGGPDAPLEPGDVVIAIDGVGLTQGFAMARGAHRFSVVRRGRAVEVPVDEEWVLHNSGNFRPCPLP
jgi:hypothetical protein